MIDWAPTLYDFFQQPVPPDVQGQPLAKTVSHDEPVRSSAMFGVFSGHVNVTDGRFVYMRAALPGREDDIANYTLMSCKMNSRYPVDDAGFIAGPTVSFYQRVTGITHPGTEKDLG